MFKRNLLAAAIGAWSANVVEYWVTHYFVLGSQIAMRGGMLLLIPLIRSMRQRIDELAVILFGAKPSRLLETISRIEFPIRLDHLVDR